MLIRILSLVLNCANRWLGLGSILEVPLWLLIGRPLYHLTVNYLLQIDRVLSILLLIIIDLYFPVYLWRSLLDLVTQCLVFHVVIILVDFFVDLQLTRLPMHVVFLVELVDLVRNQVLPILQALLLLLLYIVSLKWLLCELASPLRCLPRLAAVLRVSTLRRVIIFWRRRFHCLLVQFVIDAGHHRIGAKDARRCRRTLFVVLQ